MCSRYNLPSCDQFPITSRKKVLGDAVTQSKILAFKSPKCIPGARFSILFVRVLYSNSGGHSSDIAISQPGSKSGNVSVSPFSNTTGAWFNR